MATYVKPNDLSDQTRREITARLQAAQPLAAALLAELQELQATLKADPGTDHFAGLFFGRETIVLSEMMEDFTGVVRDWGLPEIPQEELHAAL